MSKVTVVGAGAVGATCANVMACREVASEVVLIDIKEGLSEGKMLDMYQCSTLMDFDTKLVGATNDYKKTANSDVVVITSGIPRKPGMTREELIGTNANIMKGVIENVVKYSPRAIIIVVANPMDTLTYLALKASGLPKNRIIGMGGALDSSRFKCYLAKATGANINNVDGMVIGGHGDTTMIPLYSKATYKGIPVTELLSKEEVEKGRDAVSAALTAAHLRFRPIVMTSLAFILGLLPLVFASGPGSASRQGIGTGVFFGMLVAISVGIVFVPFFFVWIYRIKAKLKKR